MKIHQKEYKMNKNTKGINIKKDRRIASGR
jgi:hypothetical protein